MWNNNQNNNYNNQWGNRQPGWGQQQPYGITQPQLSELDRSSLIQKVMWFTSLSILAAAAGVLMGINGLNRTYGGGAFWLWIIAEFVLIFAAYGFRNRMGINFIALYGFTFVTGVVIAPLINLYILSGNQGLVYQALGITAGLTFGLGLYAYTTKRDFTGWGPYLFVAVLGLLLVGILNIFLRSPFLYSLYMYAGVLIFSFYLIFDVQMTKKVENTVGNAIALAIGIYLDILNIFLFVLRILTSLRD